jgi:hypothetical protein
VPDTATHPSYRSARLHRIAAGAVALTAGGLLILTGCSSGSSAAPAAPQPSAGQSAAQGRGAGGAGGGFTSGLIADVSGKTLQVQGNDSQTAVTYSSKTAFTQQSKVSAGAVTVGSCVSVQSSGAAGGATTVTATSVAVTAAVDGACNRGFGGPAGGRPSGAPSGMPSGAPSDAPQGGAAPGSGQTPGANGRIRPVSGKVTAVKGSTITVAAPALGSTEAQTYTVTTTDQTTYTQEKAAKASAVKVGLCATAAGKTDSTGAVAATSIALRPATDGTCSFGMGRPSGQQSNG